ncbi:universal stress protein [Halostella sp. JP-L12]|uniref:universal stress protein n=1 Tax=Halostella TaxID=1843185 RepID=UPI000EF7FADC|nr:MULTISPECIES: universal stress protein [Halostella]NHN49196.1 universal stress protein [Halostella sp. JP-L12]
MYDRILLPTDGSDVAESAAAAAIALAQRYDAELHAIHVSESNRVVSRSAGDNELDRRGSQAATAAGERAANVGLDATTAVVEDADSVHRGILDYADEHDIDCIVMGTYGRTGLDRLVVGSVTERTLRESPVPVLTVHEDSVIDPGVDAVLVPTDGSDFAAAAADHAIELALTTGTALHVVYVVDPGMVWGNVNTGVVRDSLEEMGQQATERIASRAEASGVSNVETAILNGNPSREIADYAAERGVDYVVMGTHGRTGMDRYLLGSVTERVIRRSEVPVLATTDRGPRD